MSQPPLDRQVVIGVDDSAERAALLALGCADVMGTAFDPAELSLRARRVGERADTLPLRRQAGPVVLDLLHRDARYDRRWLRLHPREFGVLWRLAETPGYVVTRADLLRDVWRIACEPETNSVEVHVSRLRAKLSEAGCSGLVETAATGGYRLRCG